MEALLDELESGEEDESGKLQEDTGDDQGVGEKAGGTIASFTSASQG